ncbi:ribosomal-protein-alanine N-acetyltransferase [Microbacterium sp. W4I4]|uniref:GNAT family N-acetyltransferase n=1 Tax=Microbacterium sp. W4I4 TaxID=3042295 RepID=UPI00278311EE|nr:GNAT family N-acetyltransferase [Microbacterium sp. W4I4]MDQ0614726.1 ribosomal-protein-alanine N-acetyltransferase [Microbacterium sp. W4I4]
MPIEVILNDGFLLRSLMAEDAAMLARAYRTNRDHLEPWDPARAERFFTAAGQRAEIDRILADGEAGAALPLVLTDGTQIVGRVNVSGIIREAFQSANLGYWIDARCAGRGLMTAAVGAVARIAKDELQLHRIQAGTLLHNAASQSVLKKCGFVEFGVAPEYLLIAGRWQDHRLFQRILA